MLQVVKRCASSQIVLVSSCTNWALLIPAQYSSLVLSNASSNVDSLKDWFNLQLYEFPSQAQKICSNGQKRYVQVVMTLIPVFGGLRKICSTWNDMSSNMLSPWRYLKLDVVWVPTCTKIKDVLTHISVLTPTLFHGIVSHHLIHVLLSHINCFSQISNLISASWLSSHACFMRRCWLHQRRCLCTAFTTKPRRHQED